MMGANNGLTPSHTCLALCVMMNLTLSGCNFWKTLKLLWPRTAFHLRSLTDCKKFWSWYHAMIKYITVCYNLELFCNGFAGVQKRYNKDIQLWSNGSMVVVSIMSKSIREQRKRTGFNLSFFISLVEVLQYQFHSFKTVTKTLGFQVL